MNFSRLFASWAERLQSGTNVKNVFGEPIETHGRTLVPVARVSYGFGAGISQQPVSSADDSSPEGGGGGGGGIARPLGVLEITDERVRFIPTRDNTKLHVGLAAGFLLGLWLAKRPPKA